MQISSKNSQPSFVELFEATSSESIFKVADALYLDSDDEAGDLALALGAAKWAIETDHQRKVEIEADARIALGALSLSETAWRKGARCYYTQLAITHANNAMIMAGEGLDLDQSEQAEIILLEDEVAKVSAQA